jgi:hypothetical protein
MRWFPLTLVFILSLQASAADYCLAIRGNGELWPAHWGAMANVVEKLGLPAKQAGGSSATVTLMMNEAIASNVFVQSAVDEKKRARAALLWKSLEGVTQFLSTRDEWREFQTLYQRSSRWRSDGWLNGLIQALGSKDSSAVENLELVRNTYQVGARLGLISERNYAPLYFSVSRILDGASSAQDLAIARFYAGELKKAIEVAGEFNARTDDNLFFRPGVVDFERFGIQLGRLAEFFAAKDLSYSQHKAWGSFFQKCATAAVGKTWSELVEDKPECVPLLFRLLNEHFKTSQKSFADHPIGGVIPSFATSTVLVDSAAQEADQALKDYEAALDSKFGQRFKISNPEHIRFGYWGRADDLSALGQRLDLTDEKSRRFLSLGSVTWQEILRLSPAEPGLASLQRFENAGRSMISAGGWSDLHPVRVLRAAGCEQVVYITRRGGESLFAQGVAKRLFGFDRDWKFFDPEKSATLNNIGDATDLESVWSKLYNLGNPISSFRKALDSADAVLCTDWNHFEIRNGVKEMIRDSYRSPFFVRQRQSEFKSVLIPQLNPEDEHPEGYPTYAGCF